MISVTPVHLTDCPAPLRVAVQEKLRETDSAVLSVTLTESTPFRDKQAVFRQYRVIMNRWNAVSVLHCYVDGALSGIVYTSELIWGDILEIIRTAPDGSPLAALRHGAPEQLRTLLSL